MGKNTKIELFNDSFQNWSRYQIPKAQLILTDVPYVLGSMVFNCFDWGYDSTTPKVHPTQKPVPLLERIIKIFTDKGDVVIDPCAGSGTTLLASANMKRKAYGFEVNKKFCADAEQKVLKRIQHNLFV